ncbi:MAG: hypothetical protein JXB35_00415 [Anaerolineae bacterium]|nr:hypothetical protein [Anaerolineae bacterium]
MKRTVPSLGADEIQLYMRTYYSLLRTTEEVQIRTLEETHSGVHSSLHPNADEEAPDMSAFIYSALRLPRCIRKVRLIVLGQTEETFQRRGLADLERWAPVSAPGRRRRMLYDGKETLAAFIASISDVDDIIPMLTALQIEWNKMHTLLSFHPDLIAEIENWAATGETPDELHKQLRKVLLISKKDWKRLESIWQGSLPRQLLAISRSRKRMAVQLLAGSYVDYRRASQRWWSHVAYSVDIDLAERAIYFVSSNTHSLANMLTGFAQRHEETLLHYLNEGSDEELREEAQRIQAREVPSNWSNFLYYILKKYTGAPEGRELLEQRSPYETERGITRIPSSQTFDLEAQVIQLGKLHTEDLDPRLQDLALEHLRASRAIILNIDYPLGFAAYHLLSRVAANARELRGLYVIGKAATLNARIGDVLVPNVVYDEHSLNTYIFNNVFQAEDIARYLVYGDALDNQRALTVRGTFLQNEYYMKDVLAAGYTDAEMEAGPYLSAVYEFIRPRRYPNNELVNLYKSPFEVGILHYASDTPISKGRNLGSRNLSYYGMDPTYAASVAVLRRIIKLEIAKVTAARTGDFPASPHTPEGAK